jgi:hypothetical protein
MKEYEYRRTNFYTLQSSFNFEDEHKNFDIIIDEENVVEDAVKYLLDGSTYLKFPGAARAVAYAAADLIAQEFGENFFEVLNDPNLMHGNDPYFKTYEEDKEVYNEIVQRISHINWDSERMTITKRLLMEEYMLDKKGLEMLERWPRRADR